MFRLINTAVELTRMSTAEYNGQRGVVTGAPQSSGRIPVLLRGSAAPIAVKPESLISVDGCLVCGTASLFGFEFDTEPPLIATGCDCDCRRLMHVECAVSLGEGDLGLSWRQCPQCTARYRSVSFTKEVAHEVWAHYSNAPGTPGSPSNFMFLQAMYTFAVVQKAGGHFQEAERLLRQHVSALEQLAVADPAKSGMWGSSGLVSKSKMDLAQALVGQQKHAQAEVLYRDVWAHDQKLYGEDHHNTVNGCNNLGLSLSAQGKHPEAEELFRAALLALTASSSSTPKLESAAQHMRGSLAMVLERQKKHPEAEVMRRECLLAASQTFGQDHPAVQIAAAGLAGSLMAQGKAAEAEGFFRQSHESFRRQGPTIYSPGMFTNWFNLIASVSRQKGRDTEAEAMYREAYAAAFQAYGDDHELTARVRLSLANTLAYLGKIGEAAAHHEGGRRVFMRVYGPQHKETVAAVSRHGAWIRKGEEQRAAEAALLQDPAGSAGTDPTPQATPMQTQTPGGNVDVA